MKKFILYCLAMCCGFFVVVRFYLRQKFLGEKIPNFQEVDRSVLLRGGRPSRSGLKQLTKLGIKTVIDLRRRRLTSRAKNKNLFTFHIPFSPHKLTDQIVIKFLGIVKDPSYHPAYVHCFHGTDRTGVLCAIYRIVCQNWEKEAAIAEMRLRGLHWWHQDLIDYIHKLDVGHIQDQINNLFLGGQSALQEGGGLQKG